MTGHDWLDMILSFVLGWMIYGAVTRPHKPQRNDLCPKCGAHMEWHEGMGAGTYFCQYCKEWHTNKEPT